ncbi:hypothetical protein PGQ11_003121 [Apiospora arundinis]|uniref:Uncharacterized protein n=1 Tax=Apiospora arundinis TaxID=335852 RepID=A0ABR2J497_9PEZI
MARLPARESPQAHDANQISGIVVMAMAIATFVWTVWSWYQTKNDAAEAKHEAGMSRLRKLEKESGEELEKLEPLFEQSKKDVQQYFGCAVTRTLVSWAFCRQPWYCKTTRWAPRGTKPLGK